MQGKVVRFTEEEAKKKIGKKVYNRVEYAGVPLETPGRVIDIYKLANNAFDVIIKWNISYNGESVTDRFAKSTYQQHLSERSDVALAYP